MVHIFICEDDPQQRARIQSIINKYLIEHEQDIDLALVADNPAAILDYVSKHQVKGGLFFFDVDLQSDINGIELGAKIRAMDVFASIVFITTHSELAHMVFRYKIEAMEFITKDSDPSEIEQRVVECIQTAYQRYLDGNHAKGKMFTVKTGDQTFNVPYDDILFFESAENAHHKISLYKKTGGQIEFYASLASVAKHGPPFFRCHQSFVINVDRVVSVDKVARECKVAGGELIPVSRRNIAELLKLIER